MRISVSQRYAGPAITRAVSVWGLLILLILLLIVFSLLKPDTFPTYFNIRSILNNKSVQALLALAVFIPMTANAEQACTDLLLSRPDVEVGGESVGLQQRKDDQQQDQQDEQPQTETARVITLSLLKPDTFPTYFNIRSILNNKSVQALLALAVIGMNTASEAGLARICC